MRGDGYERESAEQLAARLAAYKRDGYTIWRGLYSEHTMASWRDEQSRLQRESATVPGSDGSETTWVSYPCPTTPGLNILLQQER